MNSIFQRNRTLKHAPELLSLARLEDHGRITCKRAQEGNDQLHRSGPGYAGQENINQCIPLF